MKATGCISLWAVFALSAGSALAQSRRPIHIDDTLRQRSVSDPRVSPDGAWVAYSVSTPDIEEDTNDSDIWMTSWDGRQHIRVTSSKESETSPRWSPDGKWLAFLSSRGDKDKGTQIWLLPRASGEGSQLTFIDGNVADYAWSPDSKRIAIVRTPLDEPASKSGDKPKTPKPIVIDRYRFKQDMEGYRTKEPGQIWLFELDGKLFERLTSENLPESNPVWSDDGKHIALLSNRAGEEARYPDWQVAVVEAKPASVPRLLTTKANISGGRGSLVWSKDGSRVFFLNGRERKYRAYDRPRVASVPVIGGEIRIVAPENVATGLMRWSTGDLGFITVDDRVEWAGKVAPAGGLVQKLITDKVVVRSMDETDGHVAVLATTTGMPPEVYALEDGSLRTLSRQNKWLADVALGETRPVDFQTPDGVRVGGMLTLPDGYREGRKLPLILWIHGGPNGQDGYDFDLERELFAANGFAVLAVNYRGSSGRDEAFQTAIFADWGGKEVVDLLAGVDAMVKTGIADPARLGIGGWSYGGILTDYTITRDQRFRAAISGAGSALQLAMYGSDQYVEQYDMEIGFPWKSRDTWLKVSYPFFEADRIRTPTLFMCGEKDFNVPVIGSEQMYQALKANGVETQLVIYPGQNHGIRKPSYVKDRLARFVAWYKKYLKDPAARTASGE